METSVTCFQLQCMVIIRALITATQYQRLCYVLRAHRRIASSHPPFEDLLILLYPPQRLLVYLPGQIVAIRNILIGQVTNQRQAIRTGNTYKFSRTLHYGAIAQIRTNTTVLVSKFQHPLLLQLAVQRLHPLQHQYQL